MDTLLNPTLDLIECSTTKQRSRNMPEEHCVLATIQSQPLFDSIAGLEWKYRDCHFTHMAWLWLGCQLVIHVDM